MSIRKHFNKQLNNLNFLILSLLFNIDETDTMVNYIFQKETYAIRGCINAVAHELGCGYLEKVYQEALELEFLDAHIPYEREVKLQISYKGKTLKQEYYADFICFGKIIIELKAVSELNEAHEAQVFNYLKTTGLDLALLVNFGEKPVKIKRLFNFMKNNPT